VFLFLGMCGAVHSPLAALTSCLKKLGGVMMIPVIRAEKGAEAEGSAPFNSPVTKYRSSRRQAWRPGMNKEEGHD
jgi:hypothetical protein